MSLYLLAVTPLTFYAACALLRPRPPVVPLELWRRFALGALAALPGFVTAGVAAGVVAGWFGASYRPAALFARLALTVHVVPAVLALAAALAVGWISRRRAGGGDDTRLALLAAMAGFGSVFLAAELAASGAPPSAVPLLVVPTLRAAILVALCAGWAPRAHPFGAVGIAAGALLFAGLVSYLYAVGSPAPAAVLTVVAAAAGAAALVGMRPRA